MLDLHLTQPCTSKQRLEYALRHGRSVEMKAVCMLELIMLSQDHPWEDTSLGVTETATRAQVRR